MFAKFIFVSLAAMSVQGVKLEEFTSFSSSTSSSSSTVDGKTVSSTFDHDDNGFHNDSINGSSSFDNGLHKLTPTDPLFESTHDAFDNGEMTEFEDDVEVMPMPKFDDLFKGFGSFKGGLGGFDMLDKMFPF